MINRGKLGSEVGYELNVNGSFLKNQVVSLAPGIDYVDVPTTSTNRLGGISFTRNQPGLPLASFYGYKVSGLWQTQEELNTATATALAAAKAASTNPASVTSATYQEGAGLGRFRYEDVNGDGKITVDDRTFIGSPVPKFTGGVNLRFTYKGFDLATYLYTSLGNKIFNLSKWYTDFYPSFPGAAISTRVLDSWTPTHTNTSQPIFEDVGNFSTNLVPNSFYVENGSYLRMQNITLGYTLPSNLLSKVNLSRVRISIAANNVFTVTGYKGLDPGVGGAADNNFGIDVGNYPITRSYNAGLSIGF